MVRAKRKTYTYGTAPLDHVWPEPVPEKGFHVVLSYEHALQVLAGLMSAVLDLQTLNRSTREGRRAGVSIGYVPGRPGRVVINPSRLK